MSCSDVYNDCLKKLDKHSGVVAAGVFVGHENAKFMDSRYPAFKTGYNSMPGILVVPPNNIDDLNRFHPYMLTERAEKDGVSGWEATTTRSTSPTISRHNDNIFIPDGDVASLPKCQPEINMQARATETDETIQKWAIWYAERGFGSDFQYKRAVIAWSRWVVANDREDKDQLWEECRNCIAMCRVLTKMEQGVSGYG